jgi:tetratricopeptide (TPR) repeat protein/tRNA A-37 threonylcarbamoyl transferase component Bud32
LAFSVGKLPAALREPISTHLDDCARCLALLAELDEGADPLLAELRQPLPSEVFSESTGRELPPPRDQASATKPSGATDPEGSPRSPWPEGGSAAPPLPSRLSPAAESRYHPRRRHARGGLGEVHIAHDQELDREVALKRIRDERAGDEDSRRRFLLEAEITSKLEHPGVVPVYGLVQGAGGTPCYAMRFVQGEPLKEAIERFHAAEGPGRDPGQRRLALRQLLGRFIAVCNTVAYAHSRGIVHRDLKPANILLGKYGETLVVDWGLAKPFARTEAERSSGEETLAPTSGSTEGGTQLGQAAGTPAYMSPEQAEGHWDEVGPASDICSLGATLYHLLTGRAPFQGKSQHQVLAKARRGDFPPPRAVQRRVPAALEAVCLKAMALEPEGRYGSALELAADVEHWLADEPVTAYREPWTARAGRWVKRHRTLVASVTAALLATACLGGGSWWWWEEVKARRQAETVRAVERALTEAAVLRRQVRAGKFEDLAAWSAALAAARQAEALLEQEEGQDDLRRRVRELLVVMRAEDRDRRMVSRLDGIRVAMLELRKDGEYDYSRTEGDYRAAFRHYGLDVDRQPVGQVAALIRQRPIKDRLVTAIDHWAGLRGQHNRAGARRLLRIAQRADPDPWRNRVREARLRKDNKALKALVTGRAAGSFPASTWALLGATFSSMGDRAEAIRLLRKAHQLDPGDFCTNGLLGASLVLMGPPHRQEGLRFYTAAMALRGNDFNLRNIVGMELLHLGEVDEAILAFQQAIRLKKDFFLARHNLGLALKRKGRLDEAIAEYREALRLNKNDPDVHNDLGNALYSRGRLDEARTEYREAIRLKKDHPWAHSNLGLVLEQKGRLDEAIAQYREAIRLKKDFTSAHHNLALALHRKGRLDEAIAEYRQALRLKKDFPRAHHNLALALHTKGQLDEAIAAYREAIRLKKEDPQVHNDLGAALQAKGRLDEAMAEYREAIRLKEDLPLAHRNLGFALQEKGRLEEAVAEFRKVLRLQKDDPEAHRTLGAALQAQGRLDEAIACYHQGLGLDPKNAFIHTNLGMALHEQGRLEEAVAAYRKALGLDPKLAVAHNNLGYTLQQLGRLEEAIAQYRQALGLDPKLVLTHTNLGLALQDRGRRDEAVAEYLQALALDANLTALLKPDGRSTSVARLIEYARLCHHNKLYRASVGLYTAAFAADPKRAEDLKSADRYQGACAAAQAAANRDKNTRLDRRELTRWRRQALSWLRADLALWTRQLEQGNPQAPALVRQRMRHWQRDSNLADLRDAAALAGLPEAERAAWRKVWADVDALLKRSDRK